MADVHTRKRRSGRHRSKSPRTPTSPNGELKPLFRSEAHKKMKHFNSDPNMLKEPHLVRALQADYRSLEQKYGAMNAQNKEYEKHIQHLHRENEVLKQELLHSKELYLLSKTVDHSQRSKPMLSGKNISIPDYSKDNSQQIEDLRKANRKYKELVTRLKSNRTAMREENERIQVELDKMNEKYGAVTAENAQHIQENNRLHSKNMETSMVYDDHIAAHGKETRLLQEQMQILRDEFSAHKHKAAFALVINDINKSDVIQRDHDNRSVLEKRLKRFQEENAFLLEQLDVLQHMYKEVECEASIPQHEHVEENDVLSEFDDNDLDEMQALFVKREGQTVNKDLKENEKAHDLGWCLWSQYFNFDH